MCFGRGKHEVLLGTATVAASLPFAPTETCAFYKYLLSTHKVMGIGAMSQIGYSLEYSLKNFLDLGHF